MYKGKPRSWSKFDNAFKVAVAREYLTGNQSLNEVARKYDLKGEATVRWFLKWYRNNYEQYKGSPPGDQQKADSGELQGDQELLKQLKEAHLKIAGLEMLIETAKKELGVDIVKKPGTKQSFK
ncbi:MAG TPA: transposase [Chitinophagaceae bacterium]